MSGLRCLELAGPERMRRLAESSNVHLVRRRSSRQVVEIQISDQGDYSRVPASHGNPLSYSHKHETATNPEKVWTLKHIDERDAPLFRTAVDDCLKRAA